MSDIPDDIMKAAAELDYMRGGPTSIDIAKAILAERERSRQLISEADKREREARAKALEEAAAIADTEEELPGEPSKLVVAAMEAVGPVGNARAAVRTTKASIAKRIRALQSEER